MVIDSHTHIFPSYIRNHRDLFLKKEPAFNLLYRAPDSKMAGMKDLVRAMDTEHVDMSVIFGFPWKKEDHYKRHNDYIIESVEKIPKRLIGLCCFDPLAKNGAKEIERCLDAGLKGVGELAAYDSGITDDIIEAFDDIMSICRERDVPVLIHTNEQVGHIYPGKQDMNLGQIYTLIKRYPRNKIILAHWGGGLFFYMLMKKEVREALNNVWFDTAASPYLYSPEIYKVAGDIMGFDKILFGSDYPLLKPGRYFKEIKESGLNDESIKKIKGENSADLFNV
jgi:predicted TIM-barrel fold metal-dependent hydrolase